MRSDALKSNELSSAQFLKAQQSEMKRDIRVARPRHGSRGNKEIIGMLTHAFIASMSLVSLSGSVSNGTTFCLFFACPNRIPSFCKQRERQPRYR